jgi:hypothetical protein
VPSRRDATGGSALDGVLPRRKNRRHRWTGHLYFSAGGLGESDGLVVVLAGAAAGYGGDRRRPVTGAAERGSRRGRRTRVRRTRRELPPANGEVPRVNLGRLRRVTLAAFPSQLLAPVLAVHGQAVRRGAPKVRP